MDKAKMKKLFIAIGVVILALSIACFVVVGITSGKVEEGIGYKPTAEEIEELMNNAESLAEMFDMTLAEAAEDLLGVSAASVKMLQLSLALRIPLLVAGLVCIAIGAALHFVNMKPGDLQRVKDSAIKVGDTVTSSVRNTVEKATVKCPNCGKISAGKTAFCSGCGKPLPKPESKEKKKERRCTNCGTVYDNGFAFCPNCGTKYVEEKPAEPSKRYCVCGAELVDGARFCGVCGADSSKPAAEKKDIDHEVIGEKTSVPASSAESTSKDANKYFNKASDL